MAPIRRATLDDAEFSLIAAIRGMPKDQQNHFIRHAKSLPKMMEESRPYPKPKRKRRKSPSGLNFQAPRCFQ